MNDAVAQVTAACEQALRACAGTPLEAEARRIGERLAGPLRVAIAGRIKAGKSTLLNALVGERLAATDAGECTRIVTTYRFAPGYAVTGVDHAGTEQPVRFRREEASLHIDLGGLDPGSLAGLEVGWPANALSEMVLIDTPGLASLDDQTSRRTRDFLEADSAGGPGADAVVFLMRHLHVADTAFLGAFMDRSVAGASPVNAVAVLSRADEIGACRIDALDSAGRIARRYADEPQLRTLVSAVVPVAGLLAETAATLREDEMTALRSLAAMPTAELDELLRSVDDVCDVSRSPLTVEIRRDLLARLGLYGLRIGVGRLRDEPSMTASDLSKFLVDRSGLDELRRLLRERFAATGRLLQARTAVRSLRQLTGRLESEAPAEAAALARSLDEIEATGEFARLLAAHLAASGAAALTDAERVEASRVLLAARSSDDLATLEQSAILDGIERWRTRAGGAFADSSLVAVCDAMARAYEVAFATQV